MPFLPFKLQYLFVLNGCLHFLGILDIGLDVIKSYILLSVVLKSDAHTLDTQDDV